MLQEVSRHGVQIMGGHRMLPEADMERYFREGMQATVGGGSSHIANDHCEMVGPVSWT